MFWLVGFVVAGKGDGSGLLVCKEASKLSNFSRSFSKLIEESLA